MNIPFLHSATKANEKIAEMATQLGEAKALVVDVTKERDALRTELATAQATLLERDQQAASVVAKFDATVADLTAKVSEANAQIVTLTAAAQTAGQQAANIVAAQGIPAGQTPAGEPVAAVTGADLLAGLNACKTPLERAKFIKANQQALAKLTGK